MAITYGIFNHKRKQLEVTQRFRNLLDASIAVKKFLMPARTFIRSEKRRPIRSNTWSNVLLIYDMKKVEFALDFVGTELEGKHLVYQETPARPI